MPIWNLVPWSLLILLLLHKLILHHCRRRTAFVPDPPVLVPRSPGFYSLPRFSTRFDQGSLLVTLLSKLPSPKKSTKPSRNQLKKAKKRAWKDRNRAHMNPKTDNTNPKADNSHVSPKTDDTNPKDVSTHVNPKTDNTNPKADNSHVSPKTDNTKPKDVSTNPKADNSNVSPKTDNANPKDENTNHKAIIQRAGLFRPELHGMDNYEKELMESLENGITPLMGILGMRGIGKTTLLKLMQTYYNQLSYFRYIFFVEAGKDFTMDMLSGALSRDIGFGPIPVVNHISSFLRNQSFLLLLDDLQCAVDLVDAGLPMKLGPQQKIVFTTRDETVVSKMRCAGNTMRMHCLDEVTSWNLFVYLVGDKIINSHPDIKDLAKEMVVECHGIPGALYTLGGLMSTKKNLEPWIVAHEILVKSQSPCEIEETENEVYPCLQFLKDEI